MTAPAPLCVGYLRRLPGTDPEEEPRLIAELCAFAEREGFTPELMFVERHWSRTLALRALTAYCTQRGVRNVIVPTAEHLNQVLPLADISKEELAQDIGGQVWIVTPEEEEQPCPPRRAENGGNT
ncbi:hypothetical protein [Streptomyces thermoalcalitolerans]|uniref:Resolvase/invertase-type recombinase catalytic domain-containing protein n=1 Tax=Streptomyces thermoalcalitolerans TaxID=65605 RepID=A0ABN1PVD1_9ACTN